MATVRLGVTDNGKTVSATVGDVIVVELAENPTTGYRWCLETPDGSTVAKEDEAFVVDSGPQMGGGGTRQFWFRAKAAGSTPISLKHWREWAGEGSVTERFVVHLRASPP